MGYNPEDAVYIGTVTDVITIAKSQAVRNGYLILIIIEWRYRLGNCSHGARAKNAIRNPVK